MNKTVSLFYNSDKNLTTHQENFLKRLAGLCAEYRIVVDGHKSGINFIELDDNNCRKKPFYVNADIVYHGDCVDDFNVMGFIGPLAKSEQLDVVAIGNYQVPKHECNRGG